MLFINWVKMKNNDEASGVAKKLWEYFNDQEWDLARKLLSEDFEAYWPQTKETIVGLKFGEYLLVI